MVGKICEKGTYTFTCLERYCLMFLLRTVLFRLTSLAGFLIIQHFIPMLKTNATSHLSWTYAGSLTPWLGPHGQEISAYMM